MNTRVLGRSDLHLTSIGLGTWAMGGGGWKFGWGPQDDNASERSIHEALDAGINWIDTAAIYGHGHAENVVGRAIKGRTVLVATKCGRVWQEGSRDIGKCLQAPSIRREVEGSLQRLGLEVIDLYQIHWPEPDEEVEEGWETMADLVREGKVRHVGVSNFNLDQLKRAQAIHPITSLQPPYSMLRREVEKDILPWCREHGVGVIAYSPMQAGLLTGAFSAERVAALPEDDWRRQSPFFTEPALSRNLAVVEHLRPIAASLGVTLAQLALAWVLRREELTAAIVGARRPGQILETVQAGHLPLDAPTQQAIEQVLGARVGVER